MQRCEVTIINKLGLHARAAAKLVQLASTYSCEITIRHNEKKASGKSIMGIMMLAASKGTVIEIETAGEDEKSALKALEALVSGRFGETE